MSKSKQTRDTARAMVSPLFAWSNAMLKGGELMLDSLAAAARNNVRTIRVAVLDEDAPPRKSRKAKARAGRATRRRRH